MDMLALRQIWDALSDDLGLPHCTPRLDRDPAAQLGQRRERRIITHQWSVDAKADFDHLRLPIRALADKILYYEPDLFVTLPSVSVPGFSSWHLRDLNGLLRCRLIEMRLGIYTFAPYQPFDVIWRLDVLCSARARWKKAKAAA